MVFALAAFGATFGIILAGVIPVQWSRDQNVFIKGVTLEVLADTDMKIFEDAGQTKEITSGDVLFFEALQAQPPLDRIFKGGAGRELFIRNDSTIPLDFLTGAFEIEVAPGEKIGYKVELFDCCNPSQVRRIFIGLGAGPDLLNREFSIVIGALGDLPEPLAAFTSSGDFLADVGPVTEIDFEALPADASSCGTLINNFTANLDNPLVTEGVTFSDSPCLELAFNGPLLDNEMFLNPGTGMIELPLDGGGKPRSSGALLRILGIGTANFQVRATDGVLDTLTIDGTGDGNNPVFAGFTSGHGIKMIEVVSTSGGPLAMSSFIFETP